jgi:glucose/arabinose dehydrogenase
MKAWINGFMVSSMMLAVAACGDTAAVPESAATGPHPTLPAPDKSLIPTVNIAPVMGWPAGGKPAAAADLSVNAYATGLEHPRWLYVLPNGDVLVAETDGPRRPEDGQGIEGFFYHLVQGWAGADMPSANRVTLLRAIAGGGTANARSIFIQGLNSPFGMALIGHDLYVANTDAILRFPYVDGETEIRAPGVKLCDLPGGPLNHHWTKNLIASRNGSHLYVSIGSNSNVGENGLDKENDRARILEIDTKTGQSQVVATGLRNPVGMAFELQTGALWAVVNERDELGSDLVPDYLTQVKDGAFYGWPFSYWGQHVDDRVKPQRPDLVAKAVVPDYALGNHVAPLGLVFSSGNLLPERYRSGAFIGEHGSWNRKPRSGYKVVFVPFANGRPDGMPVDVLTGFVSADGKAFGRPVGVAMDKAGALLVADDVGNSVWRVAPAEATAGESEKVGVNTPADSP